MNRNEDKTNNIEMSDEDIKKGINAIFDAFGKEPMEKYWYENKVLTNNKEMIKTFFKSYISKVEGRSCSSDKASYIVSGIFKALEEKKNLSLQQTYDVEKYPQMKKYEGEIAYWCPKTIKDTDEAMALLLDCLNLNFEKIAKKISEISGENTNVKKN